LVHRQWMSVLFFFSFQQHCWCFSDMHKCSSKRQVFLWCVSLKPIFILLAFVVM
jgi:hypothetical protein